MPLIPGTTLGAYTVTAKIGEGGRTTDICTSMALSEGTKIGPYTVSGLIGQGGMGEVYQARNTKLDRDVALKVPEAFTTERVPLNLIGGQGDREWYESCSR